MASRSGREQQVRCGDCAQVVPANQLLSHVRSRHVGESDWWMCGEFGCYYRAKSYEEMAAHIIQSGHVTEGMSAQKRIGEIVRSSPKISADFQGATKKNREEAELSRKKTVHSRGKARNRPEAVQNRPKSSIASRAATNRNGEAEAKRKKSNADRTEEVLPNRRRSVQFQGPKIPFFMPMRFLTKKEVEEIDAQGNGSSGARKGQKVEKAPVKKAAKRVAIKKKKRGTKAAPNGFQMQCGLCKKVLRSSCIYASREAPGTAIRHIYSCHSPLKSHWKCSECGKATLRKGNARTHIRQKHAGKGHEQLAVGDSAAFKQKIERICDRCFPEIRLRKRNWTVSAY